MRNPYHAVPGALGPQSGQAAGKLSPELKEQLGSTWDQEDSGYIDILESISFFFFFRSFGLQGNRVLGF